MADLTFGGIDIATYGGILGEGTERPHMEPSVESIVIPGAQGGYTSPRLFVPSHFSLQIKVEGTSRADTLSKRRTLKALFMPADPGEAEKQLIFGDEATMYWMAQCAGKPTEYIRMNLLVMSIPMVASVPAYAVSETSQEVNVNASPKSFAVSYASGTAYASPRYYLVNSGAFGPGNVKLKNINTAEEVIWNGSLANLDTLDIIVEYGSERFVVKKNGVVSMATVSGAFPRLKPGNNSFTITGPLGTLTITYRKRYL